MARYPSEAISVCMPRSFSSESPISSPIALGTPPMPSWIVAPSRICGKTYAAICFSSSFGAWFSSSHNGLGGPSTTASTFESGSFAASPRMRGMAGLTSTITVRAFSTTEQLAPSAPERLKFPSSSIGATETIATSVVRKLR